MEPKGSSGRPVNLLFVRNSFHAPFIELFQLKKSTGPISRILFEDDQGKLKECSKPAQLFLNGGRNDKRLCLALFASLK